MIAGGFGLLSHCPISTIRILTIRIAGLLSLLLYLSFLTLFYYLLWIFSDGYFLYILLQRLFVLIDCFRPQIGYFDDLYLFLGP